MCVANSARSQIAEGLARAMFPTDEIESAGSRPAKLNPFAVTVMREIDIDISSHYSKAVSDLPPAFVEGLDYIITLCAEEVCPLVEMRAKNLHWPLPDPASTEVLSTAEYLERFREARTAIQERLRLFKPADPESRK